MPYAYGATIKHQYDTNHLNIWLTFAHPMDQDLTPPLALWLLEADAVPVNISTSVWQDEFTLLLNSATISAYPTEVYLAYDGPNSNLQTTWGKDWEPWGPALSTDIGVGQCFVDRGDPSSQDFTVGYFTKNGSWYDLPLGSIVPEGAKAICLAVEIVQVVTGKTFYLRKNGNTKSINISRLRCQAVGIALTADVIVACDSDRKIEYKADSGTWPVINVCVKGWWF